MLNKGGPSTNIQIPPEWNAQKTTTTAVSALIIHLMHYTQVQLLFSFTTNFAIILCQSVWLLIVADWSTITTQSKLKVAKMKEGEKKSDEYRRCYWHILADSAVTEFVLFM